MYKVCPKSHEIYFFFKDLLTIPVKIVNIRIYPLALPKRNTYLEYLVTEFGECYLHMKARNWQEVKKNVRGEDSE